MNLKSGGFSAKIEKGGPYRVIQTGYKHFLIAEKPVCISCHLIKQSYRRIFHDVTLPRQRQNWSIMMVHGAIAGDHVHCKRERNIVLQEE